VKISHSSGTAQDPWEVADIIREDDPGCEIENGDLREVSLTAKAKKDLVKVADANRRVRKRIHI
jgi:hypothetical protein